eukprot:CAMPEP_0172492534 /NCGR_PEP_ID=MMETSP1066-20121228/23722_1 /TAXON_ID=671091 /ORGANISM="Coscinodiscus wailesii, Strain CCMP2513" /LENGTH=210 /DNA_ID=CAMNT_0013262219 /DNA_START=404 /DNA_END=1033 /DNA_ORIENTATION=+
MGRSSKNQSSSSYNASSTHSRLAGSSSSSQHHPHTGPLPTDPVSTLPNLRRSLDRCDVEIAALTKLTTLLHELKSSIGERALLLYFATAVDSRSNGGGADETTTATLHDDHRFTPEERRNLQKFKECMTLRRKLLNRLSRRLNRASRISDGEILTVLGAPPPPPKYGDLRISVPEDDGAGSAGGGGGGVVAGYYKKRKRVRELEERRKRR